MSEFTIRVQWSPGAMLPVLIKSDTTVYELSRLLRFACSPNNDIIFHHNGVPLNPELTLEKQMVKENDVLDVVFTRKAGAQKNGLDYLGAKIDSLVFEAARIADRHFNAREMSRHNSAYNNRNIGNSSCIPINFSKNDKSSNNSNILKYNSISDPNNHKNPTNNSKNEKTEINNEADYEEYEAYDNTWRTSSSDEEYYFDFLEDNNLNLDFKKPEKIATEPLPIFWEKENESSVLDKNVPSKMLTIEEVGQYLEKQGWSSWIW
ncbi:hypothetical protein TRFO_04598 [Tritrichomonas foetus]|uniref:Ubiquitin-like domain-containing protein n=1 Tax=Tritrichomonas foetus TaxID=1144522 RepID=A0A1J4KJG9_9EUKA|nr:hypothetical protein TRFO_04598 [Tritrichomonas foetus]|eukprot:OHT09501.1 hypothetical protein TRFO_04598 [Tritrichomonas foetus]